MAMRATSSPPSDRAPRYAAFLERHAGAVVLLFLVVTSIL
jgi:hypothetical protein